MQFKNLNKAQDDEQGASFNELLSVLLQFYFDFGLYSREKSFSTGSDKKLEQSVCSTLYYLTGRI